MPWIIIATFVSYLIGSIPTAYIFGRVLEGIDIRKFGSGNVGATNAMRVLGKPVGITVLIIDVLKGFLPIVFLGNLLAPRVTSLPLGIIRIILGIACICGHNWTVFLGFKGGKGIATTLGVLWGLSLGIPALKLIIALTILTWVVVFLLARIISVASVITALALPIYTALLRQGKTLFFLSLILCFFAILRHKSNIQRVLQGKEPRLKFGKNP